MPEPISDSAQANRAIQPWTAVQHRTPKLSQLLTLLQANREAQLALTNIAHILRQRMHLLEPYVATYRIAEQHKRGAAGGVMEYLTMMRRIPLELRNQEAIKKTTEEDYEIVRKVAARRTTHKSPPQARRSPQKPKQSSSVAIFQYKEASVEGESKLEAVERRVPSVKRALEKFQVELLIEKQQVYGDNWEKICQFFQNRQFEQLYYDFHNKVNPEITLKRWNNRQNIQLIVLREHYGEKKWSAIAKRMRTKGELQVRERFCNILDPTLKKNDWTPELTDRLMRLSHQKMYNWARIMKDSSQHFASKTDNALRRRFRNVMVRKTKHQIMAEVTSKDLAQRILKYKDKMERGKHRPEPEPEPEPPGEAAAEGAGEGQTEGDRWKRAAGCQLERQDGEED